jgi:hypothetical protein
MKNHWRVVFDEVKTRCAASFLLLILGIRGNSYYLTSDQ